ncbi:unnamed protein product [Musa acuminata var. zebrina]
MAIAGSRSRPLIRLWVVLAAALGPAASSATGLGFEFHHRFSDRVRQWAEARAIPGVWWPEKGAAEYYAALAHHDRALRGRSLADAGGSDLTFVDGNATVRLSSLGFLHYAIVALGTPNVTFLVALDTGSDLFWVPCDCLQCAPTEYGNLMFDIYSPSRSSTSQSILCNNSLCDLQNSCPGATSSCPYIVQYLSENTSSSGVLVEDILYLTIEDATARVVEAPIVFGCGVVQTGSFLRSAAPNGLFGLGMEKISVPSILSSKGLTSNSFSMCFGRDGFGRITFGHKGSSDQQETALIIDSRHPSYKININGIIVGNSSTNMVFSAIVDSGTSFTYLADPAYTNLAESFDKQVQEKRYKADANAGFPFDYCYELSPMQTTISGPKINLKTDGGSALPVNDPIIVIEIQKMQSVYCLAVLKSTGLNIIGQNFLTGLRVVFDRERLILGWKNFDCYSLENSGNLSVHNSSTTHPAAPAPSTYTQEATKVRSNTAQAPAAVAPSIHSSHFFTSLFLTSLIFSLVSL